MESMTFGIQGGVTGLFGSEPAAGPAGKASATLAELDRDAFLKLLLTQLEHQDPLSPVNDREFLSQLAQFGALEQTSNLARTMQAWAEAARRSQQLQDALALMGRTVEYTGTNNLPGQGVVERVYVAADGVSLSVAGQVVELNRVTAVLS